MMTDELLDAESQRYLDRVAMALADLPTEDRDDLMADLAGHLSALRTEGASITDRLGPPERYAAELRASAGFGAPTTPQTPAIRVRLRQRWTDSKVARALQPYATELRAGWWAVRAWLVIVLIGALTSDTDRLAPPTVYDSAVLGLLVLAGALIVSIRFGRAPRGGRRPRWPDLALSALAVFGVWAAVRADNMTEYFFVDSGNPSPPSGPITADGRTLLNVYAFDQEGNLLDGVYLFDQDGQPLLTADFEAALPVDTSGNPVSHRFPQQSAQWDPATNEYRVLPLQPPTVFIPTIGPDGGYLVSQNQGLIAQPSVPGMPLTPDTGLVGIFPTVPQISVLPPTDTPGLGTPTTDAPTPSTAPTTAPSPTTVTAPPTTSPTPTTGAATPPSAPATVAAASPPSTILVPALDPNAPPVAVPAP